MEDDWVGWIKVWMIILAIQAGINWCLIHLITFPTENPSMDVEEMKKLIAEEKPRTIDQLVDVAAQRLNLNISRPSMYRFIKANNLNLAPKYIGDTELIEEIKAVISRHGPYYGRKTVKGALAAEGIHASQRRIGKHLRQIHPQNHIRRALNVHRQLNPGKYRAPYFGYNLHLDQNEKLVDYGCVVVLAVDGFSNYLVAGFL